MHRVAQAFELFELVEPFFVDRLHILVADKHVEIFFARERFFFRQIVLQHRFERFARKLFGRQLNTEHISDAVVEFRQSGVLLLFRVQLVFVEDIVYDVFCVVHNAYGKIFVGENAVPLFVDDAALFV